MTTQHLDISPTIEPNSDQLNADDLIAGPQTVTITDVTKGSSEQPVNVHLAEYPRRAYRPSKSMRRVLVAAWGTDAAAYIGRRITIYRDPDITFGREKVGGIRISAMSGIDKPLTVPLTVSRGKKSRVTIQPLADAPQHPSVDQVAACTDMDTLREWWRISPDDIRQIITARREELLDPDPEPEITFDGAAFPEES